MLKLINIIKNETTIEADYIPENSGMPLHISMDILSKKYEFDGDDHTYANMAAKGLKRALKELDSGEITEVPKERTVMWY